MTHLLIRLFIKNHENVKNSKVRDDYGRMASVTGITTNTLLSLAKILIGLIANSIAIVADGVNNFTDATSSIIMLIGFKIASKPSDEKHPYGHARVEYITGVIVSMLIMVLGFQLFLTSIEKIRNPEPLEFSYLSAAILFLAILVKFWQSRFYRIIGELIHSGTIKATSTDSRNDVIATSMVLLGLLIYHWTGIQLDGLLGGMVALFIMYSGIQLILETSGPLLGLAPNAELVKQIRSEILSYPGVLGFHDLVVHDYGPGRSFATVHIEVDAKEDFIKSHDMVDQIERQITRDHQVQLVAHMDPIEMNNPLVNQIREKVMQIAEEMEDVVGLHDFRMVPGYTHTNIIFDAVITREGESRTSSIIEELTQKIKEIEPTYYAVITIDHSYTIL